MNRPKVLLIILISFQFLLVDCTTQKQETEEPIQAFCIDFNWGDGGPNAFAKPGLWADANPAEHACEMV